MNFGLLLICFFTTVGASAKVSDQERDKLFQLAVETARKEGLDQKPTVRAEIDQILYREFLKERLSSHKGRLDPSNEELRTQYEKNPLLKFRQLALPDTNPKEAQREFDRIKNRNEGEWGETIDFRGENQLPLKLYEAIATLRPNRFARVHLDGSLHLVQLLERKPFEQAFPPYLEYLRGKLRNEREKEFLMTVLKNLKGSP